MGLRDIESTLPPGFRFYPSDEELVCHYLYKKVSDERVSEGTLEVVDLHAREPWELPDGAKLSANEWYFFSFRDRKYSTGSRTNRATKSGYWKATGKDRTVCEPLTQAVVGMRKTLVFYRGRAPQGIKTGWVMHEFRLENLHMPPKDWVLCRVFHKMKGETVRYGQMENEQDGIVRSSMQPSSQVDQEMAHGYMKQHVPTPHVAHHHQEDTVTQNNLLNLTVWHYGFLDFQEDTSCCPPADCGKEYRFLLDVKELEDHDMGDHEHIARNELVP